MKSLANPLRHTGLPAAAGLAGTGIITDPSAPLALLARCPAAATTPLGDHPGLATTLGLGQLHLKDERSRMGLGSFKALGAAWVIARRAALERDAPGRPATHDSLRDALAGEVFACASAGNHALSVAAGARLFGATAVVYLGAPVPESFAARLHDLGARVVRAGANYEESMEAAQAAARENGWSLLSDSSWPGYVEVPRQVMEGYLVAASEVADVLDPPPTHVFLQAGVGGFAAAMTAYFRQRWGDGPTIAVVEPDAAPALKESVTAGRPLTAGGPVSTMARLDCKTPSHLALDVLAREADYFITITDTECAGTVRLLEQHRIATTPSGAAGVAGVQQARTGGADLGLSEESRVLAFVTEGRDDAG